MSKKKLTTAQRAAKQREMRRKQQETSALKKRVEEYLKLSKRERSRNRPEAEGREYWALYDQGMGY